MASTGPVIGLNLGNSYASIAVVHRASAVIRFDLASILRRLEQEGHAECIANEDGERQIALVISYSGQEQYIGNPARPQFVKNAQNTITNFRNSLGVKPSDAPKDTVWNSASVIDVDGQSGYTVKVLVPPPTPAKNPASARSTPAPTRAPSPPPPVEQSKTVTASEAMTIFLRTLKTSAEDFLGKPISGAVIGISDTWSEAQKAALAKAAEDAGIHVLQFAPEEALAVLGAYDSSAGKSLLGLESTGTHNASDAVAAHAKLAEAHPDRTTLVLDLGSSSMTLNVLSTKDNTLVHSLLPNGARHVPDVGGNAIDNLLIGHFLKEFKKQTKLDVSFPATSPLDQRAISKLRLAIDDTKKSLQASTGAAACSVESLKDGMDYNGTINRLRFDVLLTPLYATILSSITSTLESAGIAKEQIDEVLLVGASSGLSGLSDKLLAFFGDSSDVAVRSDLDGSQLIAKGAALQAKLLSELSAEDAPAFAPKNEVSSNVSTTSKPLGLVFPGSEETTIPVVLVAAETPLPARRTIRLPAASGAKKVAFEVWEGKPSLKYLPIEPREKFSDDEDDEEDEEPEVPEKEAVIEKETLIGGLVLDLSASKEGKDRTFVEIQANVALDGTVDVKARQAGSDSWVVLK